MGLGDATAAHLVRVRARARVRVRIGVRGRSSGSRRVFIVATIS